MTREIRRIAVLRALGLGDLLLAVPALRSLRVGFPEAEITLIGLPIAADFARQFGHYIDRFVPFPECPGIGEIDVASYPCTRFMQEQRAHGYDLVIQMHGDGTVGDELVTGLGGWVTAGYYAGDSPGGLTVAAPYPADSHEIVRNVGLVHLLGCPDCGMDLEFPLFLEDRRGAVSLLGRLQANGPIVGIHPGAHAPSKRWPAEYFAAIADELVSRFHASIVLIGSPSEGDIGRAVIHRMDAPAVNLVGRTSLGALAALLSRLDLFIGNDSGPAQIAYAVDTPSITLFGPVDPDSRRPLRSEQHLILRHVVPCSPCDRRECPIDHRCLRHLAPETVSSLGARLLKRGRQSSTHLPSPITVAAPAFRDWGWPSPSWK
jgi:ADP-heptose:LPS heptosyltransferase